MTKISIIIPVYNSEGFLEKCLNSVTNQSERNIEIILVDDGSTDSSGKICDEYAKKDSRIKVYHIENSGAASARNYGLEKAAGEYIMFCDSDDIVSSNWCSNLLDCINMHPTTLPFCSFSTSNSTNFANSNNKNTEKKFVRFSEVLEKSISGVGFLWNKIFIRKIIENNNIRFRVNPEKKDYNEDLIFVMSYIQHCSGFSYTDSYDYIYSVRQNSLSKTCNYELQVEKFLEKLKLWQEYINFYCNGDSALLNSIANDALFQIMLFFKNETKKSIFPTENFKRLLYSDILSDILNTISKPNESKKILSLLKLKKTLLLWIILKNQINKERKNENYRNDTCEK